MDDRTRICIAICTRKRPRMLVAAVKSVARLRIPAHVRVRVLIVENDTAPTFDRQGVEGFFRE